MPRLKFDLASCVLWPLSNMELHQHVLAMTLHSGRPNANIMVLDVLYDSGTGYLK